MMQAIIRIIQQQYITQRFYKKDDSLGKQAQAASATAREMKNPSSDDKKNKSKKDSGSKELQGFVSKRVTPPKNSSAAPTRRRPQPPGKNRSSFVQKKNKPNN